MDRWRRYDSKTNNGGKKDIMQRVEEKKIAVFCHVRIIDTRLLKTVIILEHEERGRLNGTWKKVIYLEERTDRRECYEQTAVETQH